MLHANRDVRTNPFGPCVESCVVGERGVVFVHVNKITDLKKSATLFSFFIVWRNYAIRLFALGGNR